MAGAATHARDTKEALERRLKRLGLTGKDGVSDGRRILDAALMADG